MSTAICTCANRPTWTCRAADVPRRTRVAAIVVAVVSLSAVFLPAAVTLAVASTAPPSVPARPTVNGVRGAPISEASARQALLSLPLRFTPNVGQFDPAVKYEASTSSYTLFLTQSAMVLTVAPPPTKGGPSSSVENVVRMSVVGGNPAPTITADGSLPGASNFLIGSNPANWHAGVAGYGTITYHDVYPNVDLVFHGTHGAPEYDLLLNPGADPAAIDLEFQGGTLGVDANGDLFIKTSSGTLTQPRPMITQSVGGRTVRVSGGFVLQAGGRVGFRLGSYDRTRQLVIDPTITYSTYLGTNSTSQLGNFSNANGIAVDASGDAYITGSTTFSDFPTTAGAFQTTLKNANSVAFVAKLNPTGSALVYSTYIGGNGGTFLGDVPSAIALDSNGDAYITGRTASTDYPTTAGAPQRTNNGTDQGVSFVTKLNPTGTGLVYSTFLGGSGANGGDQGNAIAVDTSGVAHVVGTTGSTDFPTTAGAFQTTFKATQGGSAFVTAIGAFGTSLVYSSYLGGTTSELGLGVATDSAGDAYVGGQTFSVDFPVTAGAFQTTCDPTPQCNAIAVGFVTKVSPSGSSLVYSTYLGGTTNNFPGDQVSAVTVDSSGNAFVTGLADTTDFPITAGAFQSVHNSSGDAFATKLNPSGSGLIYSTMLGGSLASTTGLAIALDASGDAFVAGNTSSADFPLDKAFEIQRLNNGTNVGFVTEFNTSGSAEVYSTELFGGTAGAGVTASSTIAGLAVDQSGSAFVTGSTSAIDFPTTAQSLRPTIPGSLPTNFGYVTKLGPGTIPAVGSLAPAGGPTLGGTTVVITGENFTGATAVSIGGTSATSFTVNSDTQITALTAPHAAAGVVGVSVVTSHGASIVTALQPNFSYAEGVWSASANSCASVCGGIRSATPSDSPAVVLASGKVLVISQGNAELYDPLTDTWSTTGGCSICHDGELVLLKTGKVLLVGGAFSTQSMLYDPASGTWSPTGNLSSVRVHAAVAELADSRVLVAGGCTDFRHGCGPSGADALNTAEIYDPTSGIWSTTGSMSVARAMFPAVLLDPAVGNCGSNCGKVVVSGGFPAGFAVPIKTAELFDPTTGTWSLTGSMSVPRAGELAVQLHSGKVLAVGDYGPNGNSSEVYDPVGATWAASKGGIAEARGSLWPTNIGLLSDGQVLAVGGQGNPPNTAPELYDPTTDTWHLASATVFQYSGSGVGAVLPSGPVSICGTECGRYLEMGGFNPNAGPSGQSVLTAELYTPGVGYLHVTTNPAVGSQISIDGVPADTFGLTWVKVPAGTHVVSFSHVQGFVEPSPTTVTVEPGVTTDLTGNFTAHGFLHITTSPAVAGTITVDGLAADDWGVFTDFPVGSHMICFGAVANFTPPVCQSAMVTASATTTVTGNYTSHVGAPGATGVGLLRVTTNPAVPSQITVDGHITDTYGTTWVKTAPGSHAVCFSDVPGFSTPPCQTVSVTSGATTSAVGNFTQRGYLHVSTSPAVPGTITVDGFARDDWGLFTDLPAGAHQVCFGYVNNHNIPACQNVTLTAGTTTSVTATYP